MQREEKLIEIRNAAVWRGAAQVFDGLTLDIRQHERVAEIDGYYLAYPGQ